MRKQVTAFLFAFIITAIVALAMLVVGVNAATNPNGVAVSNSPSSAAANVTTSTSSSSNQSQIDLLKSQLAQYQAREKQYQAALNSDNQQLTQASQETQMVQQLLGYLQNRGLIQISNQGQITVIGN
jgi:uncharacterized protein YpmS